MKKVDWKKLAGRRVLGMLVLVLGVIALFSPILFGAWVIALLGIALIAAGLIQFVETIRAAGRTTTYVSYATGVISIVLGVVVFVSPTAVIAAVLFTIALFLLIDGGVKIVGAFKAGGQDRFWGLLNGGVSLFLAALVWYLFSANLGIIAIGVAIGLRLVVEGW